MCFTVQLFYAFSLEKSNPTAVSVANTEFGNDARIWIIYKGMQHLNLCLQSIFFDTFLSEKPKRNLFSHCYEAIDEINPLFSGATY